MSLHNNHNLAAQLNVAHKHIHFIWSYCATKFPPVAPYKNSWLERKPQNKQLESIATWHKVSLQLNRCYDHNVMYFNRQYFYP